MFLNGNVNAIYNKDKLLKPLIEIVKSISIKNTVSKWNERKYGLVYYGIRNFGYNTDEIVNIYKDGYRQALKSTNSQIIGYAVSILYLEKKITLINEKLGFLCLSKSGGSRGILYRTDNGGKTFKEVTYPEHKVEISKDNYMDVFDFPKMPY